MPSQTFLNLDKIKQNKLIDAAMIEFSNKMYSDVSINQIIQNAGISRGSFYMYFNDKEDLFEYLVDISKITFLDTFRSVFTNNEGDLFKSFLGLYVVISNNISNRKLEIFFKNTCFYYDMHREQFVRPALAIFNYVKDVIDDSNLKNSELEFIFIMLVHNLFLGLMYGINNDCLNDVSHYSKKLHILCYGIYK